MAAHGEEVVDVEEVAPPVVGAVEGLWGAEGAEAGVVGEGLHQDHLGNKRVARAGPAGYQVGHIKSSECTG